MQRMCYYNMDVLVMITEFADPCPCLNDSDRHLAESTTSDESDSTIYYRGKEESGNSTSDESDRNEDCESELQ